LNKNKEKTAAERYKLFAAVFFAYFIPFWLINKKEVFLHQNTVT